nr:glycoside hydrolase family 9 protein [Prevotella sp.]
YIVDLSEIKTPGKYTIQLDKYRSSFNISENAFHNLATSSLKAFYLIRSGIDISSKYAGIYARRCGHPDTAVIVHPSAASSAVPSGTIISSPYGWYDAGDYNKYTVNSAYSIGLMLAVYEQNKDYFAKLNTNIPESNNTTPDILDEMMFNLKWLLTMQDPSDGGVYHKLTTPRFENFIMPDKCHQPRYVVAKSVTGTLDFAACMAQAARLIQGNKDYPDFSSKAREAAIKAYEWAKKNPDAFYRQRDINNKFKPSISTGEYGDFRCNDEMFWAATELYRLTGISQYKEDAKKLMPPFFTNSSWGMVSDLGLFSWISSNDPEMRAKSLSMLKKYCDNQIADVDKSDFQSPFGSRKFDFGWGCLGGNCCFPAIAMLYADKYIDSGKYKKYAIENIDYLLGRNATGYCYVTGFGHLSPMHPHHRISASDGIDAPMPGLLVGGPNPGQQDKAEGNLVYPSNYPDESYLDQTESYASNEIAINWNANLVGISCWIDATTNITNKKTLYGQNYQFK